MSSLSVVLVVGLAGAPTVAGSPAGTGGPVDLLTESAHTFAGAEGGALTGYSVAGAGDVNGDGAADLVIGAPLADPSGRADAGRAYVVLGPVTGALSDLDLLGPPTGFRIDGAAPGDKFGMSVAAAGDVNRDGFDDLVVGAPEADSILGVDVGVSYVILGGPTSTDVNLALPLSPRGFRIWGPAAGAKAGVVAGAGDVNDDGIDDLLVGAPSHAAPGRPGSGGAWAVFGRSGPQSDADLQMLGSRGFAITGAASTQSGFAVDGAGDVNDDGVGDLVLGGIEASPYGRTNAGSAWVIYGQAVPTGVDLAAPLGGRGFAVNGLIASGMLGFAVAGAGDVNGDGFDDVIAGAPEAEAAYVVYGAASQPTLDLAVLAGRGFTIAGTSGSLGLSVAGTGDLNGDGLPDLAVGAPFDLLGTNSQLGSVAVVYGSAGASDVSVDSLGTRGFRALGGVASGESAGWVGASVSGAGDVDGSGRPGLLVGAPGSAPLARPQAGAVFALDGFTRPGPPTDATAAAGDASATVGWGAAAANGAPVTGYTVTSVPGGLQCTTSATPPAVPATGCTVVGLTNGTAYTFTVAAANGAGPGPVATTAAVTPTAAPAPGPPAAPARVRARVVHHRVVVRWKTAAGTAVSGYTVQFSRRGSPRKWRTASGSVAAGATRFSWRAKAPARVARVRVAARNATGLGAWSRPARVRHG